VNPNRQFTSTQSSPLEVRIAQSPSFCAGVEYTITFWAIGDCSGVGLGLCSANAAQENVYFQIATNLAFSPLFYPTNVGTTDWQQFSWTFTWTGGNGLSPVMLDIFINEGSDSVGVDDILISFA
jgi:hypothetical protein